MRFVIGLVVLLGALLATVIAAEDRRPRAEVVFAQSADCFTLDPQRMTYQQDLRLARGLFEGLVRTDPDTGEPVPGVATRWSASPDGLEWRFELDPEARWSDGSPVVAEDFRRGILRALLPDTAADYSGLLMAIDGAPEFFAWRAEQLAGFDAENTSAEDAWREAIARFDETVGLACPDDRTLLLRLSQPVPYLLNLLAFPVCSPVHRPTIDRFSRLDPTTGRREEDPAWMKPGTLVSNGPYQLARRRYKRDIRLERNPHFRDPSRIASESIEAVVVEDPSTAVLAFVSGEFDWLTDVSAGYRAELLEERRAFDERHADAFASQVAAGMHSDASLAGLPEPADGERRDIHALSTFGTDFFHFNCNERLPDGRENPFADPRVRRAFALACDKRALVDRVTRLSEPIADTFIPPGVNPGYAGPTGLGFDPEAGRRELAAAGWEDRDGDGRLENAAGEPFPVVDLLYSTGSSRYRDLSLALRSMWQESLGVEIECRGQEQRFYKEDLRRGRFMIGRGGWFGDFLDPTTFLDLCRTGDGNNVRGYSSDRVDALLDRAAAERDPARRFEILAEAERIVCEEDLPILPICRYVTITMYDPANFTGLSRHAMLDHRLERLRTARSSGPATREPSS
ncbi:MAG: peptide ABC transporter substrate-binding protein [Phycisphaerales bacterium]